MKQNDDDYYAARERAERAAAEKAASLEARRAHEKLAQAYALKLNSGEDPAPAQ